MSIQPFTMGVYDLKIACLMEVSIMFNICRLYAFLLGTAVCKENIVHTVLSCHTHTPPPCRHTYTPHPHPARTAHTYTPLHPFPNAD